MRKQLLIFAMLLLAAAGMAATPASRLLHRLEHIERHGIMLGHQDDTFYGHNWHGEQGRSDILETVGDHPAVMGFDLGGLEIGDSLNLDHVPFSTMRREIVAQYERGGIITLSWHCRNLINGKTAWDPQGGETETLLDGGRTAMLDSAITCAAQFIASLKSNGKCIPVIFRPWHEMNGDWFWWGGKNTTPQLYQRLYRHIHDKLQKLCPGQIVWAFSPNLGAKTMDEYYPGDKYVDIVGIDIYDFDNNAETYSANVRNGLTLITSFAKERHKLAALTETGCQQLPQEEWFTRTLWQAIGGYKISYVLLWRNAWDNEKELYVAYPGHPTERDFKKFASHERTLFVKDIRRIK